MAKKLSSLSLLKWIIGASITLIAVMTLWLWVHPESLRMIDGNLGAIDDYGGFERLVLWQRVAGFIADAIPATLIILALIKLYQVLGEIAAGNWFDQSSELSFRRIGHLMLWNVLAHWLNKTVIVLILTATNEVGKRVLAIELSSEQLLGLVPALMSLVIAEMVRHARAQRDELSQII